MSAILKYLKDHAWWFNAVFVAVVVNVVAGLLRGAISSFLSRISKSYAERKKTREAAFRAKVQNLASDHTSLILCRQDAHFRGILAFLMLTLCMVIMVGELALADAPWGVSFPGKAIINVVSSTFAILGVVGMWQSIPLLELSRAAIREYARRLEQAKAERKDSHDSRKPAGELQEAFGALWDENHNPRCLSCKKPLKNSSVVDPATFYCSDPKCNSKHVLKDPKGFKITLEDAKRRITERSEREGNEKSGGD